MKLAFFSVVAVGAAIGLSVPNGRASSAPVAVATSAPTRDEPRESLLERSPQGHFYAVADVNDEPIRFLVDTGATTVALTEDDARRAHVPFDPNMFSVVGRGAAGDVLGQEVHLTDVVLDGKRVSGIRAVVLEDADMSLLGQNYLSHMNSVEIKGDTMRLR